MRRTLLSLACCLLMLAPAIASTPELSKHVAAKKSLTNSLSVSKSNDFRADLMDAEPVATQAYKFHKKYLPGQNTLAIADVENRPNFQFEENSYNFVTVELAPSLRNPKKISSREEVVPVTYGEASFGNGMFYGFAIMVILLNLICYFLFDESVFLFYSLSLVSVVNLLFFTDGLLPMVGIGVGPESTLAEGSLILLNCMFASWFAARYLNLSETAPRLRFASFLTFGSAIVLLALGYAIDQPALVAITNLLSFGVVIAHFGVGMFLFSKKSYPKFYVIAYFIPLLFAVDYFVFRNLGYEFLLSEPGHLKAAVLAEMLLITYAIMFRMKAIKEEHELRQTELRIFLKRQEMMNRKTAMQLMEDVYLENLIMHYDLDGLEIKLLQYISEGKDNAKIARKLKTTEAEIEELTKELYQKLEIGEHIKQDYRMVDAQPDYIYN